MTQIKEHMDRQERARFVLAPLVQHDSVGNEFILITTVDDPPNGFPGLRSGVTTEATLGVAVQALALRTHRPATPEEIEAFHLAQHEREVACRHIEEARKETTVTKMDPELRELIITLAANAQQPKRAARGTQEGN